MNESVQTIASKAKSKPIAGPTASFFELPKFEIPNFGIPKMEIPGTGWFAFFEDPSGNKLALYKTMNPGSGM